MFNIHAIAKYMYSFLSDIVKTFKFKNKRIHPDDAYIVDLKLFYDKKRETLLTEINKMGQDLINPDICRVSKQLTFVYLKNALRREAYLRKLLEYINTFTTVRVMNDDAQRMSNLVDEEIYEQLLAKFDEVLDIADTLHSAITGIVATPTAVSTDNDTADYDEVLSQLKDLVNGQQVAPIMLPAAPTGKIKLKKTKKKPQIIGEEQPKTSSKPSAKISALDVV